MRTVCEAVLGPDYRIVEVGFDTPFPGAQVQPWPRDFRSPPETWDQHRLTSLAFNLTTVDTTDEGRGRAGCRQRRAPKHDIEGLVMG